MAIEIVEPADIGVGDLAGQPYFRAKSPDHLGGPGQVRADGLDGHCLAKLQVDRFEDLRDVMTVVEKVPAFSLVGRQGDRLRVRVRAELGTRTILFFIPTTRTTDWAESNRFVVDPNGAVLQGGESDED